MSLKNRRKIYRTLGFKLTAWYSGAFVISVFLLLLFTYFYLQATLAHKDHAEIRTTLRELEALHQSGGLPLMIEGIRSLKKFPEKNKFFIRLADKKNRTLFLYLPYQWVEFDIKHLTKIPPSSHGLIRLPGQHRGIFLEISSVPMNGYWLQVGLDTRERTRVLKNFKEVALIIIAPLLLLGVIGGNLLAYHVLRPIRHLIDSVQSISQDMTALGHRVPNPHTGDELEELIRLFNEMLEKIETLIKAMKQSLDNVAHDLRTPVTRLRCVAELALQSHALPEECQSALAECLEDAIEIQKLLNMLMDISEAETGVLRLDLQPLHVRKVVEKVTELYGLMAEEKGIALDVEVPPDLIVLADPTRLGQALANLVDNAVKFTPPKGHIRIRAFPRNGYVGISVQDTGPGIPEKDLPRIWDRLYRGDLSRAEKGLGLGLSLVKAIIARHKGTVEVVSTPGEGSTFTIFLPSASTPSETNPSPITKI